MGNAMVQEVRAQPVAGRNPGISEALLLGPTLISGQSTSPTLNPNCGDRCCGASIPPPVFFWATETP